jgi:SP family general alpha glucoside:H+ symporter-like MFS transporter
MNAPTETKEPNKAQTSRAELLADAEDAVNTDHGLTTFQAIKLYPKACAWSMVLSAALIMDGYDYHVIPALYALPSFEKKFGQLQPNGGYTITAAWQSGLSNGSTIGQLPGLFLAGYLTEIFGFRKTLVFTLVLIPCIIFIQFFASNLVVLEVGQILLGEWLRTVPMGLTLMLGPSTGVPLGLLETITIVYAVEVAPTCLRGFLTSYVSQM